MRRSKSSTYVGAQKRQRRPKSAALSSISKQNSIQNENESYCSNNGRRPKTERATNARRRRRSYGGIGLRNSQSSISVIPPRARKRYPRIDDQIRTRYPEWTMTSRRDDEGVALSKKSPGPIYIPKDDYVLEANPKWSIRSRIEDKSTQHRSPGPIYNPSLKFTKTGAPGFSLIPRREEISFANATPAPNQYNLSKSRILHTSRSFALKGRLTSRSDVLSNTPGPLSYDITKSQRKKNVPSTKIGKRLPDMTQNYLNTVPGPARYIPKFDSVMHRSSRWSMGSRFKVCDSRDDNPGPGYYGPPVLPPFRKKKKRKNRKRQR